MQGVQYSDTLTVMECGRCGITFAVPEQWRQEKKETGDGWYCPNGHQRVYRESDIKRLEREVATERARRLAAQDQVEASERSRRAIKGHLTRVKQRIANGVCPACDRHFENVERHMKSQHPDFVEV